MLMKGEGREEGNGEGREVSLRSLFYDSQIKKKPNTRQHAEIILWRINENPRQVKFSRTQGAAPQLLWFHQQQAFVQFI